MRALCWHGKGDVRVDTVPDPTIQHPRDAIIKITAGDLRLRPPSPRRIHPTMESGDILGHEFMGEVWSWFRGHAREAWRPRGGPLYDQLW